MSDAQASNVSPTGVRRAWQIAARVMLLVLGLGLGAFLGLLIASFTGLIEFTC